MIDNSNYHLWLAGDGNAAVSYTHLDVYKRQHVGKRAIRSAKTRYILSGGTERTMSDNRLHNQKLKLMTILGTRPAIIRLSEVIKKCDKYFDHILVHTGQTWDYTCLLYPSRCV